MHGDAASTIRNILVVDDDPSVLELMGEVLRGEGCNPLLASNPMEALTLAESKECSLAFLDIELPGMNGIELTGRLKAKDPHLDVVIMTGYGTLENAVQAIKIGVADFIRKPFSIEDVFMCLRRHWERQAFRERIRQAEQRYADLVQHAPMMIFSLRKDFGLGFVNRACRTVLGFDPSEVVDRAGWLLERVVEEDRDQFAMHVRGVFEGLGDAGFLECRLRHREGHVLHCLMKTFVPAASAKLERLKQLEGIAVDITDRVLLEKALVQKEKLKTLGAVAAEVAHEIRNPLVAIGGFARRLHSRYPEASEAAIILDECRRLERILDRIRNYLSPVDISLGKHAVEEILHRCKELMGLELERKGMRCRLEVEPGLEPLSVDANALLQVFINLVRNAIHAMQKGDELVVRAYRSAQYVMIRFQNPCRKPVAIHPDALFLPFDEGGQTIGLPLSYRLIRSMGGVLNFSWEEPYAVFTVSLPRFQEREAESYDSRLTPAEATKRP
ncbi:ATP-binding response regulator [Desulfosoma caldarium]|uniref:histidine kinase n=1 Tax=Desulfosoma caldarium TaxID=610254 RepID=A0A3N1UM75_9BACT|nr:response regulator [Desulfosoma caldarium]ROQ92305.1 PAS domain S-box-containing protein [Desulfosoma caldarium]